MSKVSTDTTPRKEPFLLSRVSLPGKVTINNASSLYCTKNFAEMVQGKGSGFQCSATASKIVMSL